MPFEGVSHSAVAFSDVDEDQDQDLFLSRNGSTKLFANNGSGVFTELLGNSFDGMSGQSIAVADVDEDDDSDMVIIGYNGASFASELYINGLICIYKDVRAECAGYTWIDGNEYNSDNNTATYTLSDSSGCDIDVTLDLTIRDATTATVDTAVCDIYTAPSGATFTTTGMHTDVIPNAAGCDSTITVNLYVNEVPTITHFTSRTSEQWRVRWEYLLPETINDTNFRIRYWEQGTPAVFTDRSQFPHKRQKKITGLDPNTWYDVKVGFACLDGSFKWSMTESVKTKNVICPTPTGLQQQFPLTAHQATVTWSHGSGSAFKLRRKEIGAGVWEDYATTATTSKTFKGLQASTLYDYQIKAYCPSTNNWSAYTPFHQFSTGTQNRLAATSNTGMPVVTSVGWNQLQFNLSDEAEIYNITLRDMTGKLLAQTSEQSGQSTWNLVGVSAGSYVIHILSEDGSFNHSEVMFLK